MNLESRCQMGIWNQKFPDESRTLGQEFIRHLYGETDPKMAYEKGREGAGLFVAKALTLHISHICGELFENKLAEEIRNANSNEIWEPYPNYLNIAQNIFGIDFKEEEYAKYALLFTHTIASVQVISKEIENENVKNPLGELLMEDDCYPMEYLSELKKSTCDVSLINDLEKYVNKRCLLIEQIGSLESIKKSIISDGLGGAVFGLQRKKRLEEIEASIEDHFEKPCSRVILRSPFYPGLNMK